MVVVFASPTFGAKPDMGKIGKFGFTVDFDPALINGLFKAFDVFACSAMEALDV